MDEENDRHDVDILDEQWLVCRPCMANSLNRQKKIHFELFSREYFICDDCSSPSRSGYEVTAVDDIVCSTCVRAFDSAEERIFHPCPGPRIHKCHDCGKEFQSTSDFYFHTLQHSKSLENRIYSSSTSSSEDKSPSTSEDTKGRSFKYTNKKYDAFL